jgi:hypothetical protein
MISGKNAQWAETSEKSFGFLKITKVTLVRKYAASTAHLPPLGCDLLQNPIGTLVGTTAIAAKCEDLSLSENLGMGTRGVLI